MSLIGLNLNKENPSFTIDDFIFWMPQFAKFCETENGKKYFEKLYKIANNRVYYSIFGNDWELGMSYVIAHYLTLIANQMGAPSGSTLDMISGGGNIKGVMSSAAVGNFSKQYDLDKTLINSDDSKFWNQTSYGASFMALLKTKAIPSIFVVTNGNIPGGI